MNDLRKLFDRDSTTSIDEQEKVADIGGLIVHIEKVTDSLIEGHTDGNEPYYIVKEGDIVAHGRTERAALLSLKKKKFSETSEEQRIAEFISKYQKNESKTVDEWAVVYQTLTGACDRGVRAFIRSRGLKRYDKYTTFEFLDIVDGAYGGDIVSKVKHAYEEKEV